MGDFFVGGVRVWVVSCGSIFLSVIENCSPTNWTLENSMASQCD